MFECDCDKSFAFLKRVYKDGQDFSDTIYSDNII